MFGAVLLTIFKAIWKVLKLIATIIAKIIVYFGLWMSILFLIFGAILHWTYGFELFDRSTDSILYILGLCLTLVIAVLLSIRNLIVKPYRKYFKKDDVVEYGKKQRLKRSAPEAPTIYKSKVNPGVIVYEYKNRYDLYEEDREGGLVLVNTEYKK